jgi:hypothetical protein
MVLQRHLFALVLAALILVVSADAQTTVVGPIVMPQVRVDTPPQTMCPLSISVVDLKLPMMLTVRLSLQNTSDKPIRAYVLVSESGDKKHTRSVVRPVPVEPGKMTEDIVSGIKNTSVSVTLDYVEFADGSTWGSDAYGRSKQIAGYFRGRELAIERLKQLLGDQPQAEFWDQISRSGSYSFGEPAGMSRPNAGEREAGVGYRVVVDALRRMRTRTQEALELARKLEIMTLPST